MRRSELKAPRAYKIALAMAVMVAIGVWFVSRDAQTGWYGVPPAPERETLLMGALGDSQFAYRQAGMTLQNLGNEGGLVTPLSDYNYTFLRDWFFTLYELDRRSDFIPMLAAYYFGATRDPEDSLKVVDFLEVAGDDPKGEKWRWLAQAVYIARFRADDMDRALEIAYRLAELSENDPNVPIWARQMPAFVLTARGETEAARDLMMAILGSDHNLPPNEINFMQNYIEERLSVD